MPVINLSSSIITTKHPFVRRLSLHRLFELWRSRQALGRLDQTRLDDLGLSRTDAQSEAAKPVWDVPQSWRER